MLAKSADSTLNNPIVNVDSSGNTNDQLNDIALLDCTVVNMASAGSEVPNQYGLAIAGGTNIKVIGGTYSNNSSSGGAGIAITGPCGDVQVIGANLQPSYPNASNINDQQYGLVVSGSPLGTVLVSSCDMTGYTASGSAPVSVTGTPTELLIYNCAGYNDQNKALNGGVAPTSSLNAVTCSTPYYGPSVFVFWNSTAVTLHVFGQTISMTFGIIFLPNPYDSFYFSHAPSIFAWVGK